VLQSAGVPGWVYIRLASQRCGWCPWPHPLFGYPVIADASEVDDIFAPKPRSREHESRDRDAHSQDDPGGIHERSVPARAIAGPPSHRGMMMGGTRLITASNSALGLDEVPATMNARSVSEVALAATYKRE